MFVFGGVDVSISELLVLYVIIVVLNQVVGWVIVVGYIDDQLIYLLKFKDNFELLVVCVCLVLEIFSQGLDNLVWMELSGVGFLQLIVLLLNFLVNCMCNWCVEIKYILEG